MRLTSPFVTVYRFENHKGLGPWSGGGSYVYDVNQDHDEWHSCGNMPCPYSSQEVGSKLHDHAKAYGVGKKVFGFLSLTQLLMAFPSAKGRAAMGAIDNPQLLTVWSVPADDVVTGNAQVIFSKERATRIGTLDLTTLKPTD